MKDYKTNTKVNFKYKYDLANFIKHCMEDAGFWINGNIPPAKEQYYMKKNNMTKEQMTRFYKAMVELQNINLEINGFINKN